MRLVQATRRTPRVIRPTGRRPAPKLGAVSGSTFLVLALATGVVAAIRGVWSPCGLSMLSSITPMTERGRGNRFGVTATWFLVGGILGGLSIGALAALGAAGLHAAGLGLDARLAVGAVLAAGTAAIDLGVAGVELPIFKRQVNDAWLRQYRSWVYGGGFGWQIGFGVATYIMTGAVFLTIGLAVLSAAPAQALLIGLVFGTVRGSAVFLGRTGTTPAALGEIHERLDAWGPAARTAAAGVQVAAASVLAGLAWHPVVGAVVAVGGAAVAWQRLGHRAPQAAGS